MYLEELRAVLLTMSRNFDIGVRSDTHEVVGFTLGVRIETIELCILIVVCVSDLVSGSQECIEAKGGRNSSVSSAWARCQSVAGSILLWGHFPVEGIFLLELTWVQTPFPQNSFG